MCQLLREYTMCKHKKTNLSINLKNYLLAQKMHNRPGQNIDQFDTSKCAKKIGSSHKFFVTPSFINIGAINLSQPT